MSAKIEQLNKAFDNLTTLDQKKNFIEKLQGQLKSQGSTNKDYTIFLNHLVQKYNAEVKGEDPRKVPKAKIGSSSTSKSKSDGWFKNLPLKVKLVGIVVIIVLVLFFAAPQLLGTLIGWIILGAIIIGVLRFAYIWFYGGWLMKNAERSGGGGNYSNYNDPAPQSSLQSGAIIGKWETEFQGIKASWTFDNKGVFEFTEIPPGGKSNTMRGNYRFDGDQLTTTVPGEGASVFIINSLDGSVLVMSAVGSGRISAPMTLTKARNQKKTENNAKAIIGKWEMMERGIVASWIFNNDSTFEHKSSDTRGEHPGVSFKGTYRFDGKQLTVNDPSAGSQIFVVSNLDGANLTIVSLDSFKEGRSGMTFRKKA
jgi:hypothetical protein